VVCSHRHRPNHGGHRQVNRALHTIAVSRIRWSDQRTCDYVTRRNPNGEFKADLDTLRRLKRYTARVIYPLVIDPLSAPPEDIAQSRLTSRGTSEGLTNASASSAPGGGLDLALPFRSVPPATALGRSSRFSHCPWPSDSVAHGLASVSRPSHVRLAEALWGRGGAMSRSHSLAEAYTREIRTHLKRFATWEPGVPLRLGDYGELRGSLFDRVGNVADDRFRLTYATRTDETHDLVSYASRGDASIEVDAATSADAGPLARASAGMRVAFSRENAVVLNAAGVTYQSVEDHAQFADDLLAFWLDSTWNVRHVVITELVSSASTTVIIASEKSAAMSLVARGEVPRIDLADARLRLAVSSQRGIGYQTVTEEGMTPLFGLSKVRPRGLFWWRRNEVRRQLGFSTSDAAPDTDTVPQSFQSMLDSRADDLLRLSGGGAVAIEDAFGLEDLQPTERPSSA
jgi:hypothetical protein